MAIADAAAIFIEASVPGIVPVAWSQVTLSVGPGVGAHMPQGVSSSDDPKHQRHLSNVLHTDTLKQGPQQSPPALSGGYTPGQAACQYLCRSHMTVTRLLRSF